jgi:hypothetical protein
MRAFVALEANTQKLAYQNNLARTRQFDRDDSYRHVTGEPKDRNPQQYSLALIYKMRRWLCWDAGLDINARV